MVYACSRVQALAAATALILLGSLPALGQGGVSAHQGQPRELTPTFTTDSTNQEGKARQIALDRYRFVRRLGKRFDGTPPIGEFIGDYLDTVLFPVGRADRVYVFLWAGYWHGAQGDWIFCYQQTGGRDKLIYRISLKDVRRPPKSVSRVNSLLDYIAQCGEMGGGNRGSASSETFQGKISTFARGDLAQKRQYVQYTYDPMAEILQVGLLSDTHDGHAFPYPFEVYDVPSGPSDDVENKFYREHGLPLAKGER